MTLHRKLHCSNPKCPHETKLKFSDWIRENLPSSEDGFMVSDVDFILYNYKTKRMSANIRGLVTDAYHMGYDSGFTKDQSRRENFDKLIREIS